ncbi:unnamed protein product [Brassica napus]|uniref:(rape) hypothetical protein n=1 Tax=Brassica napus TaxID=3708 RepID=A0A816ZZM2_BRANA|nr:unnamed protein product [Brassica napus]
MSPVVWVCDPLLWAMFPGILSRIRWHLDFILYVFSVSSIKIRREKKEKGWRIRRKPTRVRSDMVCRVQAK